LHAILETFSALGRQPGAGCAGFLDRKIPLGPLAAPDPMAHRNAWVHFAAVAMVLNYMGYKHLAFRGAREKDR